MSQAVYVYIDFKIKDLDSFEEYSKQVPSTVLKYGGETLAVQKHADFVMGERDVEVQLIQRWPNRESFNAWQASPEYAPLKEIRDNRAIYNLSISLLSSLS